MQDQALSEEHFAGDADERAKDAAPQRNADANAAVRFASEDERDAASAAFERAGMIVAELEGIGPSLRGRLGEAIDEALQRRLSARGAAPPGITSGSDRDATLSDQLFRARRIGATGLAIVLGPLRALTGALAALEPEDCATLRFLASATRERPVALVLDARDGRTGGYGDPVALGELLSVHVPAAVPMVAVAAPPLEPVAPAAATPAPVVPEIAAPAPAPEPAPASEPIVDEPPAVVGLVGLVPLARHTAGATLATSDDRWRTWTLQLAAARGPQPLAMLEKLFAESYMPLANALASGLDDPRARHAHDEFAATFSKGYREAFATFASTTKRPRMVLDAHDVAARIARLHGARSTRVMIVDAMRMDVARLVEERLVATLGVRASLTDELLLWSALPTVTLRQLETLARGVEALRAPAELEEDPEPPRGRTAEYVRRMRVGPREIHKLDLVESRVRTMRGRIVEQLPELADATAEAIARHVETLAPRTLLLVTGDHGFTIDRNGAAKQGGSSPEEVLVGAFAMLIGDVH
jgi:hypothetical protein